MKPSCYVVSMLLAGLVAVVGLSSPVAAHHSFAMFDKERAMTLKGVVRKIEWKNPHVYFYVENAGDTKQYAIECGSINALTRTGWKVSTLKVGDAVSMEIFPLRNGELGGLLNLVTLPNGAKMTGGSPPPEQA
jgi:hypothetical protein